MNRKNKNVFVSTALGLAAAAALLAFGCGEGGDQPATVGERAGNAVFVPAATLDELLGGSNGPRLAAPAWAAGQGEFVLATSDGFDEVAHEGSDDGEPGVTIPGPGAPAGQPKPGSNGQSQPQGDAGNGGGSNPGAPATGGDSNDPANAPVPSGNSNSSSDGNDGSGGSGDTGKDKPAPAQSADSDMPEIIFPEEKPARDRFDLSWPGGSGSDNYPWPDLCELRGCVDVVEAPEPNAKPNATADTSDQAPKIWIKLPPLF